MTANLFISYAWTSSEHREWVRLLAAHLHLLGYEILIDEDVDYGVSLNGFMREAIDAAHVLLIVDENYVARADEMPDSGVGIENRWFQESYAAKPDEWLSVLFVRNPNHRLPRWLSDLNPKGFDFNARVETSDFPGSEQVNEL